MAKREQLSRPAQIRKGGSSGKYAAGPVPGEGQIVEDSEPPFADSARRFADATASLVGDGAAKAERKGGWL